MQQLLWFLFTWILTRLWKPKAPWCVHFQRVNSSLIQDSTAQSATQFNTNSLVSLHNAEHKKEHHKRTFCDHPLTDEGLGAPLLCLPGPVHQSVWANWTNWPYSWPCVSSQESLHYIQSAAEKDVSAECTNRRWRPGLASRLCGRLPLLPLSLSLSPSTALHPLPPFLSFPPPSIGCGRWLQWVILGPRSKANYSRRLCKM